MKEKSCLFCEFSNNKDEKDWENKLFFMRFDSFPCSPGHALIIPKRHIVDIFSLNKTECQLLKPTLKEAINYINKTDLNKLYKEKITNPISKLSIWFCKEAIKSLNKNSVPTAYNHGVNDGKAAGRTINHLHWHIIPRYNGDVNDPTGGVRYVIPKLGNYKAKRN